MANGPPTTPERAPTAPVTETLATRTRPLLSELDDKPPSADTATPWLHTWSPYRASLLAARSLAPFGDVPPASTPPYSLSQLLEWGTLRAERAHAPLIDAAPPARDPTGVELTNLVNDCILRVESFSRKRFEVELGVLEDQLASCAAADATRTGWTAACARFGAAALSLQLAELPWPTCSGDEEEHELVDAESTFAPIRRLTQRLRVWQALVARPQPGLDVAPQPCASQDRVPSCLDAAALAVVERAHGAGSAAAQSLILQLRLVSVSSSPVTIRRVTVAEEVCPTADDALAQVAQRDIYFEPPVELRGLGRYLVFTLKMCSCVSDSSEAPPRYSVTGVECA